VAAGDMNYRYEKIWRDQANNRLVQHNMWHIPYNQHLTSPMALFPRMGFVPVPADLNEDEPDAAAQATAAAASFGSLSRQQLKPARQGKRKLAAADDENQVRERLVKRWRAVVLINAEASEVGRQLMAESGEEAQLYSLRATFANTSTATLAARLSGGNGYLQRIGMKPRDWPPSELQAWRFLIEWASVNTALSRAKAFNGFGMFCFHILGFSDMHYFASSARLRGAAIQKEKLMGQKVQAEVLTAAEMSTVQAAVESEDLCDDFHMILSSALAQAALRARHFDMRGVVEITQQQDFVVAKTLATKTGGRDERDLQVLMGPALFLSETPWLGHFLKRREQMKVAPRDGWPLMPAKSRTGEWKKQPARLSDYNALLREALEHVGVRKTTSHAMKAEALSWAARRGLPSQVRAALGYHRIEGESRSVRCYARDRLTRPVQEMSEMLREMRDCEFDPDKADMASASSILGASQSATQKWSKFGHTQELTPTAPMEPEPAKEAEAESEGESEDDAEDSSDVDSEASYNTIVKIARHSECVQEVALDQKFVHKDGKTHWQSSTHSGKTACGKLINANYTAVAGIDFHGEENPCDTCARAAGIKKKNVANTAVGHGDQAPGGAQVQANFDEQILEAEEMQELLASTALVEEAACGEEQVVEESSADESPVKHPCKRHRYD